MSKIPQGEWNAIAARYENGESISKIARSYGCTPPAIHYILKRNRQRRPEMTYQPNAVRRMDTAAPQLVRTNTRELTPPVSFAGDLTRGDAVSPTGRAGPADPPGLRPAIEKAAEQPAHVRQTPSAAVVPGLDSELHLRAEAAIELFRSSFDAALTERSPVVCERLRQAATDLMRVAARTTMVLDRLNAILERSERSHNYPRSAHSGDDFGKLG